MRIILLILLTILSFDVFPQSDTFKVKDGSFHQVEGCITIPAHYDQNDLPMAVIKIIPENINEQDRTKLRFEGNLATDIEVVQKVGETWVYVTAQAITFLRIKHPDFGATEYNIPFDLEPKKCYEMVLQNTNNKQKNTFVAINTEPNGVDIYIDGKHYGKTPNIITEIDKGEHELKLEKEGYNTLTKSFSINDDDNLSLNETLSKMQTEKENQSYIVDAQYDEKEESEQGYGVVNGYYFVDLGLPSGTKWATVNIGGDASEDYGGYFAWGETKSKSKFGTNSLTNGKKIDNISGKSRYDAARSNWGNPWRIPTKAEFQELQEYCIWEWTSLRGKKGYKITGSNGNYIFLPAAGSRRGASLGSANEYGYYWCSEQYGNTGDDAYDLYFNSNNINLHWNSRSHGLSIRPVL